MSDKEKTYYEKLMERWQNNKIVATFVFLIVTLVAGVASYQKIEEFIEDRSPLASSNGKIIEPLRSAWTLPGDSSNPTSARVFDHHGYSYDICYQDGDGEFIYIDNSKDLVNFNSYTGDLTKYPRIRRGECEVVAGDGQKNIGLFLDTRNGATTARGTKHVLE